MLAMSCSIIELQDWWIYVSADKLVFPKLWRVLQEGAFGNAVVIYPLLLPLLTKIKLPKTTGVYSFYSRLLSSLISG